MTAGRLDAETARMARVVRAVGLPRLAFAITAWAFLAGVVIQVFLVGVDIFADGDSGMHRDFAYLYGWLAPALVLLAGLAGVSGRTRALAIALLVLFAIQTVLPTLRDAYPALAILHTPNALAIFGLAVVLARRSVLDELPPGIHRWGRRDRPTG